MRVGIIGAGSVGTGMGILLSQKGYIISGVASRTWASAQKAAARIGCPAYNRPEEVARRADLVLITTNDQAIGPVAEIMAARGGFRPGQTVMHMSGSLTSDVLSPARKAGAWALSLHPMQSCADADRAVANLPGSVFSIEGDREAYPLAEKIVRDLEGEFFYITAEAKPLYHAAACVASNYLVALVDLSRELMAAAGVPAELAARALDSLSAGTRQNISVKGVPEALTGPISRGDLSTVTDHIKAMRRRSPELLPLYTALGRYTVGLARRKGSIDEHKAATFLKLMTPAWAAVEAVPLRPAVEA